VKTTFPILAVLTALLLVFATYQALIGAPTEAVQGDVQRILYYHAPSAWTAFCLFFVNFASSIVYLWGRSPGADALAVASAEVGVVFSTVNLVTGPIWARPIWGIWWTWDLRLTLTLVLWLIYVSYLLLRRFSNTGQTAKLAAVLAIFGAIDVPMVYFSIWFFRTQHPQPVIGGGGSMDPRMLHAFFLNLIAFSCYGALVCWSRYRLEVGNREVEERQAQESLLAPEAMP
jgi:heme exporter protein C